jgi:hypothetical protein
LNTYTQKAARWPPQLDGKGVAQAHLIGTGCLLDGPRTGKVQIQVGLPRMHVYTFYVASNILNDMDYTRAYGRGGNDRRG